MSLMETLQIPTSRLDLFIRSVDISSYLPGRVRLYAKRLVGNRKTEWEIRRSLLSLAGIQSVETSTVTGSILIQYDPEVLRQNAELRKVEDYIMRHARRK